MYASIEGWPETRYAPVEAHQKRNNYNNLLNSMTTGMSSFRHSKP